MWNKKSLWFAQNSNILPKFLVNINSPSESKHTHLLFCVIISIGLGLYFDFIYAWKSGKNPSAIKETIRKAIPIV